MSDIKRKYIVVTTSKKLAIGDSISRHQYANQVIEYDDFSEAVKKAIELLESSVNTYVEDVYVAELIAKPMTIRTLVFDDQWR